MRRIPAHCVPGAFDRRAQWHAQRQRSRCGTLRRICNTGPAATPCPALFLCARASAVSGAGAQAASNFGELTRRDEARTFDTPTPFALPSRDRMTLAHPRTSSGFLICINAPEGCQRGTHTNETAYPLGVYTHKHTAQRLSYSGRTLMMASTSTAIPRGSVLVPMAERAWYPRSPKTCIYVCMLYVHAPQAHG